MKEEDIKEQQKATIIKQINLLKNEEDLHDFAPGIHYAIEECFTHTQTGLDLAELFSNKVHEIKSK